MQTVRINTWNSFKAQLKLIYKETERLRKEKHPAGVSEAIFRGQADADWDLVSSLEREEGSSICDCSTFTAGDIKDYTAFVSNLRDKSNALYSFVGEQLGKATTDRLGIYRNLSQAKSLFVKELNRVIRSGPIYDRDRFSSVILRPQTKALLGEKPRGEDLVRLNRLLLEDALPMIVARKHFSLAWYYKTIFHPSLRMLKGSMDFDLPDLPKNLEKLTVQNLVRKPIPLQSGLAMLRHYGFPCPLLDWTLSPFVAAYFAFSPKPSPSCRHVAIFCYREFLGYGKLSMRGNAQIRAIGPWAPVNDERHIRQQSQYTVAIRDKDGEGVEFCPHEDAIRQRPFKSVRFDEITKFILPVRIRDEVLSDLRRMNITEYSLFNTTDALVRTIARFAFSRP